MNFFSGLADTDFIAAFAGLSSSHTSPYSRAALAVHIGAFTSMYLGINATLVTSGPFRLVRNPIYLGLNLLALGSAVWLPSTLLWNACRLMFAGLD